MSRPDTITGLSVKGFKSIADEQYIALRPLTVLAGANSSGKSSIMQPLLLLKQTLEAPGDPGSLWLGGPNVRFTAADQLLSRLPKCPREFSVKLHSGPDQFVGMTYTHSRDTGFEVSAMDTMIGGERSALRASMSHEEADVGLGVSQSLPVVVALLAAQRGQLLYLEQPEIHLHPLAQRSLAKVLAAAASRGVVVVVETHSALLLREMQTLIAKDELDPKEVALHWFRRDKDGATTVKTAQLDDTGAYGDWPEDFDDTELRAEQEYLDAVEAKGGPQ